MPLLLAILIAAAPLPSSSTTSWMRPESFHLYVGMSREAALSTLTGAGWKPEKGDGEGEMTVDYTPTQSLTLKFQRNRLRSIRFELFTPIEEIDRAFEEERAYLRRQFGLPKKVASPAMLIYDAMLPNVMAVVSNDRKSQHGQQGLGVLVVRYFDPATK